MQGISFKQVDINGGFWGKIEELNRRVSIYSVRNRFEETGRFKAFKLDCHENPPHIFWDSDVAKWIEGAAYIIAKHYDSELEAGIEEVIDDIEKNQDESGYFNVYFTVCEPGQRFKKRTAHELYCAGHLIEAAVAYYEATGRIRFLQMMCKYANYIERVFVKEQSAGFVTPGHEEIELALIKLYRCTGQIRYLNLAQFFIDNRGNNHKDANDCYEFAKPSYDQSHLPVREQATAEGHAVRACYLYSGMVDLAKETGDASLQRACESLFENIVKRRMYITGGLGSSYIGEAFTIDYDLPNLNAYSETCAAISLAYFAQRMLGIKTDSVYADAVERVLYNGIISGLSLDGKSFFYENPLEINPKLKNKDASIKENDRTRYPITQRLEVFDCSCCPPNLNRFIASVGDYIYTEGDGVYYIHQYIDSELNHNGVKIIQKTDYPVNGRVAIQIDGTDKIALRIPGWCEEYIIDAEYSLKDGYAYIKEAREIINVEFVMKPTLIGANEKVSENIGRAAMQLGPVVYCLEEIDNGANLRGLMIDRDFSADIVFDDYFRTNIIVTENGYRPVKSSALYAPFSGELEKTHLKFIPYYAFANRGENEMLVWIRVRLPNA